MTNNLSDYIDIDETKRTALVFLDSLIQRYKKEKGSINAACEHIAKLLKDRWSPKWLYQIYSNEKYAPSLNLARAIIYLYNYRRDVEGERKDMWIKVSCRSEKQKKDFLSLSMNERRIALIEYLKHKSLLKSYNKIKELSKDLKPDKPSRDRGGRK